MSVKYNEGATMFHAQGSTTANELLPRRVLVHSTTHMKVWNCQAKQRLTSHHYSIYRSYRGRVFTDQTTQPTVSKHWKKLHS